MQAALIVMTILGCDDSVTQCRYIDTVNRTWQTVALCDAQSEAQIGRYQNSNYPVIVAVCESNGTLADAAPPEGSSATAGQQAVPAPGAPDATNADQPGLAARTLAMLKNNLPDPAALKSTMAKPFRYAEDGYSWVVRKFND